MGKTHLSPLELNDGLHPSYERTFCVSPKNKLIPSATYRDICHPYPWPRSRSLAFRVLLLAAIACWESLGGLFRVEFHQRCLGALDVLAKFSQIT